MAITQETHWDDVGIEPGAGDAEYTAGQQPISEHDNWFNWSAAKDVENLIAALENVATGHDHDGANSKQVDGSDVVNTPAGTVAATDVQAAIDELDSEKLANAAFDANTILKADSDDTPVALTVAEQTLVGRITAGVITALTAAQVRTLLNVENGADVTDTTNVDAAGAAMNSDKDVANGIAGLDASVKLLWDQLPLPMLTVVQFQANAATGTAANPERINDGSVMGSAVCDAVGEYMQVLFPHPMFISEYRQYGEAGINGDGVWKIQIYHDDAWHDNTTGISTLGADEWSAWAPLTIPAYTQGLRLVATTLDTAFTSNFIQELEIRG